MAKTKEIKLVSELQALLHVSFAELSRVSELGGRQLFWRGRLEIWIDLLVLFDLIPPFKVSIHIRLVELGHWRGRELGLRRFLRFFRTLLSANTINPFSLCLHLRLRRSV